MDKEAVHIYSTQKECIELIIMRWMNIEPIIQSKVSQKVENNYCILTHIYGI